MIVLPTYTPRSICCCTASLYHRCSSYHDMLLYCLPVPQMRILRVYSKRSEQSYIDAAKEALDVSRGGGRGGRGEGKSEGEGEREGQG